MVIDYAADIYTYYDADPNLGSANLLGIGSSYDPAPAAGTTSIVYVTTESNGCISIARKNAISVR